jgi:aryl-alcohol dehydrogenase-like predicted oxidoreductase
MSLGCGLRVSPVCLGMVDDPDVISAAFDAGINFFFITADLHWPHYAGSREGLRRLLSARPGARAEIVVAAASYVTQPDFFEAAFHEVLEAVPDLGRIDMAVIGGTYSSDFFARLAEYKSIRPGRAAAIGATFHHRQSAVIAINHGLLDVAFIRYNAAHRGAESDVLPALRHERTARLFNFKSTAGYVEPAHLEHSPAGWQPQLTDHYRFVLGRPEFDGLLCSLSSVAEVASLRQALELGPLSLAQVAAIERSALASPWRDPEPLR